jgi:hypothetical protein
MSEVNNMKYIVTNTEEGKEEIFIFPDTVSHTSMAEAVCAMRNQTHGNWVRIHRDAVAAGFIEGGKCVGKSESLGISSRPQDSELLGYTEAAKRELDIAREGLELYRDLTCEKCGHHAHPDEICGFCALAEAKIYSEDVTHPEGKPQFQQGGTQHEIQGLVTAEDCQGYCDRLEELTRELKRVQTWQPIETAPRDGTHVLLAGPSGYSTTPLRVEVCSYESEYRPQNPWVNHASDAFSDGGAAPTCWMPLPAVCESLT